MQISENDYTAEEISESEQEQGYQRDYSLLKTGKPEIHEQEYELGFEPPDWSSPRKFKPIPLKKNKKNINALKKQGRTAEEIQEYEWRVPTLPTFYKKKGPLYYLESL